jgi:hypothetical protein
MIENKIGIFSPSFPNPATFDSRSNGGKIGGKLPWWNNGVKNTRSAQCPGEEWTEGRLVRWKWFNDGVQNVRSNECPAGFAPGRIMPRNNEGKFTT